MESRVFVDCDLTLVNTRIYPLLSRHIFSPQPHFMCSWQNVVTEVRPSASSFLKELSMHYKLSILTLGHSQFQKRVLAKHNLLQYVDGIWGPDNSSDLPQIDHFVLIDDMDPESLGIAYKMHWLGHSKNLDNPPLWQNVIDERLIRCQPFLGGHHDNEPLTTLTEQIHEKMRKAS